MKKFFLAGIISLMAGFAFGQMRGLLDIQKSVNYHEALPAYYQKYMSLVSGNEKPLAAPTPEKLFHLPIASQADLKWVELPGKIKLQYAEQGDESGIPVIFLHGFTDSWHSYESVMQHLPRRIHAYALSQRGHGNSDRPDRYDPRDFASDIEAFMNEEKIPSAIIVGHSMGATIAQRFALDYPNRVEGLVLAGTFASFSKNPAVLELNQIVNHFNDPIKIDFAREFQKGTLAKPVDSAYFNLLVNESMKLPAKVWKEVLNGLMNADYVKELSEFKKPTIIIWGDKDAFCPKSDQEELVKAISSSMLIVYEGHGHGLHWEDPARFANDIVDFARKLEDEVCD